MSSVSVGVDNGQTARPSPWTEGAATDPTPPNFNLDWLLAPATTRADFFAAHWETRPLMIARDEANYFRDFPGLNAIDELLTATATAGVGSIDDGLLVRTGPDGHLSERKFRLNDGGVTDIQDIYRAYADGYSVVVNRLHRRSAQFAALCRALEQDFHCPIGANLYLSPVNSQGFRSHVDNHDVFILQLHGAKEWHIADPSQELPLSTSKRAKVGPLVDRHRFFLTPGDTLYIPRGFPHEAATTESSSLHLTISVNVYRWLDLFGELISILAERELDFRQALPPKFLETDLDPAQLSAMADLIERSVHDPDLVNTAKRRLGGKLLAVGKAAAPGHFASIDAISALVEASVVRRVPGMICQVECSADQARIEFATNFVAGPLRLKHAFSFIAQREQFSLQELPEELSPSEKVDLVGRLISEGLLRRINSTNGESDV